MAIAIEIGIPEKNCKQGERVEDMEFLWGILKKYNLKIPGVKFKRELAFPGVIKKVLVLGPGSSKRGSNTILQDFSRGEASFCLELPRTNLKSTNLKIPQFFFQKSMSSVPPAWSFSGIAHCQYYRLATKNKYIIIVVI